MSITFHVVIEEAEAGWFAVECPTLPACASQRKTREEAIENIKDAISGWLAVRGEKALLEHKNKVVQTSVIAVAV